MSEHKPENDICSLVGSVSIRLSGVSNLGQEGVMRFAGCAAITVALLASVPSQGSGVLGADAKAGLWEDRIHDNWAQFAVDPQNQLPPKARKQLSDDLLNGPAGVRRICALQQQASHPLLMAHAGTACSPGAAVVEGHVASFDLACKGNTKFHAKIEFISPEHITIRMTEFAAPDKALDISTHDLRWVSADCRDIESGQIRELISPIDRKTAVEAYRQLAK